VLPLLPFQIDGECLFTTVSMIYHYLYKTVQQYFWDLVRLCFWRPRYAGWKELDFSERAESPASTSKDQTIQNSSHTKLGLCNIFTFSVCIHFISLSLFGDLIRKQVQYWWTQKHFLFYYPCLPIYLFSCNCFT